MIITSPIDLDEDASRAAGEAQRALTLGETDRAREHFGVAGDILERKIASLRKQPDKHFARFLAASQYYHGGNYQKARELARQVEKRFLPVEAQPLFEQFFRDVKERADPGYEVGVRNRLQFHLTRKEYETCLEILRDHPYSVSQAQLAYSRAFCYEHLRDWPAAAIFYADAIRQLPEDPELLFSTAGVPLSLAGSGDLAEAWRYVEYQLEALPNAVTFITASLIRFHQAPQARDEETRSHLLAEQVEYVEKGWQHFQRLPDNLRRHQDLRRYMVLGFEVAALALERSGNPARAREFCDEAIAFDPQVSGPWTLRGTMTYPGQEATADFLEAIRLGEPNYYPFYFLAHARLVEGDLVQAVSWIRQALERRPSRKIAVQLYFWLAIAQRSLGANRDEVLELLQKACSLDPENELLQRDIRRLEDSIDDPSAIDPSEWVTRQITPALDDHPVLHEAMLLQGRAHRDPASWELAHAS
jgi:tetratricopeptide (TPR) repeat protein